jgi:hypothetical protein
MLIPVMVPIAGGVVPRHQASSVKSGSRYFTAFGVDLSPDNMAVAIVYFVQGVLGLARLAVSFYLKDDLHLDPAEACGSHSFLL